MFKVCRNIWKTVAVILLSATAAMVSACNNSDSPGSRTTSGEVDQTRSVYASSDTVFSNPERGFYGVSNLLVDRVEEDDYDSDVGAGRTLTASTIRLDDYRNSRLPELLLDNLRDGLESLRNSQGIKAILRFSYNSGFNHPDAPKNIILDHINQLKPIFQEYADVIAFVPAGFIGSWGEWHHSTNQLLEPQHRKEIITALLDALPESRMVQIRYPFRKRDIFAEIDEQSAFSEEYTARIGHHNDCFLARAIEDEGYLPNNDASPTEIQDMKEYIRREALYTPVGGESCEMNLERDALKEMEYLRWTYINAHYFSGMIDYWRREGHYTAMQRKLGYRFELVDSQVTGEIQPGGLVDLQINLRNEGWASLYNPRSVYIVIDNGVEQRKYQLNDEDPRWWAPNKKISLDAQIQLPAEFPEGEYTVALWLPDESEHLQDNPAFSIRFANKNVWDAPKGYNVLTKIRIHDGSML